MSTTKGFKEHANFTASYTEDQQWEFNEHEARYVREDNDWIQYKDSWNEKWQIVKDIMCGKDYHGSELLANVRDIAGTNAEE